MQLFFPHLAFIEWRIQFQLSTELEIQTTRALLPAPSLTHSGPLRKNYFSVLNIRIPFLKMETLIVYIYKKKFWARTSSLDIVILGLN